MKILFVVPGYKPAWRIGGPVISVSSLAEELVQQGHEVIVFTTNSNLDQSLDVPTNVPRMVDGVEVWYFERHEPLKKIFPKFSYLSQSLGFLYSRAMKQALEKVVPTVDIVHTHLPFIYPTWAAAQVAFKNDVPLFYHQRGVFDPSRLNFRSFKKKLYIKLVEIPILKKANTLIALTDAEKSSFRRLGVDTPIQVIPNGIHTDKLSPPKGDLLKSYGITKEDIVVLFLGRIHPIKGAEKLLDACMIIQKDMPSVKLVLAGPDEYGLQGKFADLVATKGDESKVVFPGMVEGELKRSLLSRADLFCLPSAGEGFSMAVLEALANATAVLLSPGCHFPQVELSGAGVICNTTAEDLASSLRELLGNKKGLKEMGRAGRALVEQEYSWRRVASSMSGAYHDAIIELKTIS